MAFDAKAYFLSSEMYTDNNKGGQVLRVKHRAKYFAYIILVDNI